MLNPNFTFGLAEKKRLELIKLKKLGPKFHETHPKAIYTSRALSSLISSPISINSSIYSLNNKIGYTSKEYEFDIHTHSSKDMIIVQSSNTQHLDIVYSGKPLNAHISSKYVSKEYEFDVFPSPPTINKRNIEESATNTQVNQKQVKTANDIANAVTFKEHLPVEYKFINYI
ncbi:18956_t:CDS:2 [Funneliformis geosporum]|uniref:18956_t:CDS:1 n=1 Tax=Funneliformis geosporum TaxID=1117311 RepID=A0A9W4SSV0_9GLOM|nr:18956_t:CDS:2 [Funneliformis geosporum]